VRFLFLKENQNKYNIKKACKILKISRSGYYDYLHRRKSKRSIENEALAEIILDIFKENEGRYGSRRIQKVMLQKNIKVNEKRVSRIMSEQGLIAKGAKKLYRYYPNRTQYEERENILNRVFTSNKKNKVWVGDITYIPTRHGFLYLAIFIDIFSRKVVGWSMDTKIKDSLVMSAFYQAIGL
jgi:putative transposase